MIDSTSLERFRSKRSNYSSRLLLVDLIFEISYPERGRERERQSSILVHLQTDVQLIALDQSQLTSVSLQRLRY